MKLPCWMALALLLLAQTALAQHRISRTNDDESSGDVFYDDEDLFSGSGSGFPYMDVRPTAADVTVTTEETLPLSTTQATGPAPSASPAAEPSSPPPPEVERESGLGQDSKLEMEIEKKFEELEEEEMRRLKEQDREWESEVVKRLNADKVQDREQEQERSKATVAPRLTDVPVVFVDSSATLGETTVATSDPEDLGTTEEEEDLYITTETIMLEPSSTPETTVDDITTTEVIPTTAESTTAKPTRPRPAPTTPSTALVRPRKPHTTPSRAAPTESSTRSVMTTTQTQTPDETVNNEVAGPGPTGDFEIRENEGRQGNEVGRGRGATGVAGEPDLNGNTVDAAGSSAAQLPQKNILERKEVLIAVIVGGVVGALFAAFLVMLLVYRMKKKDEGSYTLEEPKQATVTYQKPDKQEEFYA
uniref:Syndecan n=1 Tax=Cyprinus carpio carpio TaxID=630221 RepID=A0A9J7X061_CYPCA